MSDSPYTFFQCDHIGVAGTTPVVVRRHGDGTYEARVGIALMGLTNMPLNELANANPFDDDFYDNYANGHAATERAAIEALKRDMKSLADTLWAE
jgi:hypothetical protein